MLLTKKDFKVGQIVAGKHSGNKERYNKGYSLGEVVKVGNKLVTVKFSEKGKGIQFILEKSFERDYLLQKSNCAGDYELFPSEQAYLDYIEKNEKLREIQSIINPMYGASKLSVEKVRRIYDIITE